MNVLPLFLEKREIPTQNGNCRRLMYKGMIQFFNFYML